ncbi:hypothetical protein WN943_029313 [Citrus x changshan-huyou]
MDIPQMQEEMLKLQCGPVFGFVKLRLCSTPRSVVNRFRFHITFFFFSLTCL